jgi:hypothetical protein
VGYLYPSLRCVHAHISRECCHAGLNGASALETTLTCSLSSNGLIPPEGHHAQLCMPRWATRSTRLRRICGGSR